MLGTPAAPTLETERLLLRGWRPDDFAPYAAMLADAETARFITPQARALTQAEAWDATLWLVGHWQMLGHGMFVVEERVTGAFLGRVGPLRRALDQGSRPLVRERHRHAGPGADQGGGRAAALLGRL